jgi:hypothetical protein
MTLVVEIVGTFLLLGLILAFWRGLILALLWLILGSAVLLGILTAIGRGK